jgi:hypothetical protein
MRFLAPVDIFGSRWVSQVPSGVAGAKGTVGCGWEAQASVVVMYGGGGTECRWGGEYL